MTERVAYTVKEVAELLGVRRDEVYRWLDKHRLPGTKIGGSWFVHVDHLDLARRLSRREQPVLPAIVYRAFDAEGDLLYVGVTTKGPLRWEQHAATKPWWNSVARIDVAHYSTVRDALDAERFAIGSEHPRYNVRHRIQ